MNHYQNLIFKSQINGGGSTSESYVYQLLSGDVQEGNHTSIFKMWRYLGESAIILEDIGNVSLHGLIDSQITGSLIECVSKKWGRRSFFDNTERCAIDRMSDDEYNGAIQNAIADKRMLPLERE